MNEKVFGRGVDVLPPVSAGVARFPQQVPTLRSVSGPLIGGAILGSLSLCFFAVLVPKLLRQDGVPLGGPIGAIVGLLSVLSLVLLLWILVRFVNDVVRRRAWTCYIVNSRSMAICIPGRPALYVKRRDCVRCYPRRNQLVLRDGCTANLGLLKGLGSVWAPLCERWWPEVWSRQANFARDYYIHALLHVDVLAAGVLWVVLCMCCVEMAKQLGLGPDTELGFQRSLAISALVSAVVVVVGVALYRWRRGRSVVVLGEEPD